MKNVVSAFWFRAGAPFVVVAASLLLASPGAYAADTDFEKVLQYIKGSRTDKALQQEVVKTSLARIKDPKEPYPSVIVGHLRMLELPPEQGVPIFIDLLHHPKPSVRSSAVHNLKVYGEDAASAEDTLFALRKKSEHPLAFSTALAAIRPDSLEYLNDLLSLLETTRVHPGQEQILRAVQGMRVSDAASQRRMAKYMETAPTTALAYTAYRSLAAKNHSPESIETALASLVQHRQNPKPDSYQQFSTLLTATNLSPRQVSSLWSVYRDGPVYVKTAVLDVARRTRIHDPKSQETLVEILASKDNTLSAKAYWVLRQAPLDEGVRSRLIKGLSNDNQWVRTRMGTILGSYEEDQLLSSALPAIRKAMEKTEDIHEFTGLLHLARRIGPDAKRLAPLIADMLPLDSKIFMGHHATIVRDIRAYMVLILSEIGPDPRALPVALELLTNQDHLNGYAFACAARSVCSFRDDAWGQADKIIPLLLQSFDDSFQDVMSGSLDVRPSYDSHAVFRGATCKEEAARALRCFGKSAKFALPALKTYREDHKPKPPLFTEDPGTGVFSMSVGVEVLMNWTEEVETTISFLEAL